MRAQQETNGWFIRTLAISASGLVILINMLVLGVIFNGMQANSARLASIELRLAVIERDIRGLTDDD